MPATPGCACATKGTDPDAIVRLAEALSPLRLQRLQAQGGVLRGEAEVEAVTALHELPRSARYARPQRRLAAGDAGRLMRDLRGVVAYAEDPCGAEDGFSGRGDGRVPPRHWPAHGHQHDRHRLAPAQPRAVPAGVDIPWPTRTSGPWPAGVRVAQTCRDWG